MTAADVNSKLDDFDANFSKLQATLISLIASEADMSTEQVAAALKEKNNEIAEALNPSSGKSEKRSNSTKPRG